MSDRRRHRGAHPEDAGLFAEHAWPTLRAAVEDLSWLLGRGYAPRAALALVGDRWRLRARQRLAVRRCACSDAERTSRRARSVFGEHLRAAVVWIDGFNVLTTIEAALGGGVLLLARDGALRDMASMHGSYRAVEETRPAIAAVADVLEAHGVARCRWLLDAPVSNSGRLAGILRAQAVQRAADWEVEVVRAVDDILERAPGTVIVASADSRVMDGAPRSWQLARETVERMRPRPRIIDLSA
jgi:hypothetical protein